MAGTKRSGIKRTRGVGPSGKASASSASLAVSSDLTQFDLFSSVSVSGEAQVAIPEASTPQTPANQPIANSPAVYSVSELSQMIRAEFRRGFARVLVRGEVTDFRGVHRTSGHLYFSIKDESSQIRVVMWRGQVQKMKYKLEAGLEVIVTGQLDFYGGSGSTQIVAESIEPVGVGALQLKFEQLKEKLRKEGLFDSNRKRTVAPVNYKIGIVTGRGTAALKDMLRILEQRFPVAEVYFFHASVQGDKAAADICRAIESAGRFHEQCPLDVLIVGRGGGSYEDLFCFNDEQLARALAVCPIPTVSAVGHEIDVTISDFVADKRSATPSHAAQEVVPEQRLWLLRLEELLERLMLLVGDRLQDLSQKVDATGNRLIMASPQTRLRHEAELLFHLKTALIERTRAIVERFQTRLQNSQHYLRAMPILGRLDSQRVQLDQFERRFVQVVSNQLNVLGRELERREQVLAALSPLNVLERGFVLVEGQDSHLRTRGSQLQSGDAVRLRFFDSTRKATIGD